MADEVPRVVDVPNVSPLFPRVVSGTEAVMIITMGAHR
jgi:hypothetical protein